ncbi:hypothetical protein CVT24_013273 [Panaeolus cyanescens]|uniref:Uncharacterized protein n=1 Tax=Panaeolus cyanescens TaxID=181874 RepID=A0A409VW10_9AGAR|nr:hypothetical protein CVT24_013273 [Panaeolus cyanescens]
MDERNGQKTLLSYHLHSSAPSRDEKAKEKNVDVDAGFASHSPAPAPPPTPLSAPPPRSRKSVLSSFLSPKPRLPPYSPSPSHSYPHSHPQHHPHPHSHPHSHPHLTLPRHALSPRRILSRLFILFIVAPLLFLGAVVVYGGVSEGYGNLRGEGYGDLRRDGKGGVWGWGYGEMGMGRGGGVESGRGGGGSLRVGQYRGAGESESEGGGGGVRTMDVDVDVDMRGRVGYLRFPDHIWGHGFNNVLQEALLTSYLAYVLNRTYVFEDYTWSHLPFPYTIYDFTLRPTSIPMTAFLGGPIVGEPFPLGDLDASSGPAELHLNKTHDEDVDVGVSGWKGTRMMDTMAVSAEYFKRVCRDDEVVFVDHGYAGDSGSASTGGLDMRGPREGLDGVEIVDWWVWRMRQDDVVGKRFFGSQRVLSLFPSYKESPVLKYFQWSPIIRHATDRVVRKMTMNGQTSEPASSLPSQTSTTAVALSATTPNPAPGLVAVHLRRGDYKRHCARLARWGSTYMGFNQFEGLVDRFEPQGGDDDDRDEEEQVQDDEDRKDPQEAVKQHYLRHCLPTIPQLVKRLRKIRAEHAASLSSAGAEGSPLRQVYIMTNAWPSFISSLRDALKKDGWSDVWSTADIEGDLTKREKGVGVGVDMALAVEKAEVFVGNGFSSLTSNIIMLRVATGFNVSSNRFL